MMAIVLHNACDFSSETFLQDSWQISLVLSPVFSYKHPDFNLSLKRKNFAQTQE